MRLLVVEDEPLLAEAIVELLGDEGYEVDLASTGSLAETALAQFRYDLVLLDWTLPPPSGSDLLRGLRAAGNAVPVLVMSGDPNLKPELAQDLLAKPFGFADLVARVQRCLAGGGSG